MRIINRTFSCILALVLVLFLVACGDKDNEADRNLSCTFAVSCKTALDNMDKLDEAKKQCVPDDGWIIPPTEIKFAKGESAFDVLQRECKADFKVHLESAETPLYNSVYLEGINNLYEFDCGNLSGWMYKVNDWFPNYGCSRYELQDGDVLCFEYTCDLGADVGGDYFSQH